MSDREKYRHTEFTRNGRIFVPLKKMLPLLVLDFFIVPLFDCTKNVPLIDLERTTRYSVDFFPHDSGNLFSLHS